MPTNELIIRPLIHPPTVLAFTTASSFACTLAPFTAPAPAPASASALTPAPDPAPAPAYAHDSDSASASTPALPPLAAH